MAIRRITIRVSPELHAQLTQLAADRSVSLNRLAEEALQACAAASTTDRQRLPLRQLAGILSPPAEAAGLSEEELLYEPRKPCHSAKNAERSSGERRAEYGERGTDAGGSPAREALEASGRLRPLAPGLRRRIIPGVTLEEVRSSLARAGAPSLSEIVLEQRGPRLESAQTGMETTVITIQVADDGTLTIPDDLVRTLRLSPRQTIIVRVGGDALVLTPSPAERLERIGDLLRVALADAKPSEVEAGRQDRCF